MYKLFHYRFIVLLLIMVCLTLSNCSIKSLNPIFTEKDLILEPQLVGEWIDEENEELWIFQKPPDQGYYDLVLPINQKSTTELEANLVKLSEFTFLDFYPKEPKKADFRNSFYKEHFIAAHSFCLVSLTPNQLQLAFLDLNWLKEKAGEGEGKINIPHLVVKSDVILTASTQELQKFLVELAPNKEAFSLILKLKRKVAEVTDNSTTQTREKTTPTGIFVKEQDSTPFNVKTDSLFNFQNSFWINLHHFLYQQALLKTQSNDKSTQLTTTDAVINKLTPTQKRLWDKAINFYQTNYVKGDLLLSDEMVNIKQRLIKVNNENDLKKVGLPNALVDILATIAPIYQNTWWIAHERTNQAFINNINVMLSFFEPALVEQFKQAYQSNWQEKPIRVDVSVYAYKRGAYTTLNPGQIVIASGQEGQEGFRPLEILFYQASYLLTEPLKSKIGQIVGEKTKVVVKDLLPAILIFTSGEIVRQVLAKNGLEGYIPYNYANGDSKQTIEYRNILEKYWQPYLLGKTKLEEAIKQLVENSKLD